MKNAAFRAVLLVSALLELSCSLQSNNTAVTPVVTSSGSPSASTATATPLPPCATQADMITAVHSRVRTTSGVEVHGCRMFAAGTEVVEDRGGTADVAFYAPSGACRFNQLPGTAPGRPKMADVFDREPDAVFRMTDGEARCSVLSGVPSTLCGSATLLTTGGLTQYRASCNSDPFVDVAVRVGLVTLTVEGSSGVSTTNVDGGKHVRIDLETGQLLVEDNAIFSEDEFELFTRQADFLGAKVETPAGAPTPTPAPTSTPTPPPIG